MVCVEVLIHPDWARTRTNLPRSLQHKENEQLALFHTQRRCKINKGSGRPGPAHSLKQRLELSRLKGKQQSGVNPGRTGRTLWTLTCGIVEHTADSCTGQIDTLDRNRDPERRMYMSAGSPWASASVADLIRKVAF